MSPLDRAIYFAQVESSHCVPRQQYKVIVRAVIQSLIETADSPRTVDELTRILEGE